MKENIHLKVSASDKQELAARAKELGLSLSSYIRLRLKESSLPREVTIREIVSNWDLTLTGNAIESAINLVLGVLLL